MAIQAVILEVEPGVYLQIGAGPEMLQVGEIEIDGVIYFQRSQVRPEWLTEEWLDYEICPYENQPGDLVPVSALRPCFRTWSEENNRWEIRRGISVDGTWDGMKPGALKAL